MIMNIKNLSLLPLIFVLLISCEENRENKGSAEDAKAEVLQEYNDMYEVYSQGDQEFFQFYEEDFVRLDSKGNITKGVSNPRQEWKEFMNTHSLKLLSYGQPEMIVSPDQVVTINDFEELFIQKEEQDTAYNRGVYVAVWSRQPDDTWKISMDTWHAGLEQEK